MRPLADLQQLLHYEFTNCELLRCALTHRSLGSSNYERLEFLGDAVLDLIIAQELYERYPDASEGELSRMRSTLVNRDTLANIARQLQLSQYLLVSAGEARSGGLNRESILSDCLEAIIGALYLDSNLTEATQRVVHWYDTCYSDLSQVKLEKDAKSQLQEILQAKQLPLPNYQTRTSGEAHAQTFHVTCHVEGYAFTGFGESTSQRKAQQLAAQHFLEQLHD